MKAAHGFATTLTLTLVLAYGRAAATPVGTAFTYQGVVEKNGVAINGSCSIKFTLYDALTGGSTVGAPNPNTISVTANQGLFTVTLDFGASAFTGDNARWLEIAVEAQGDQSYTTLTPRQPVTPVPYAMYAISAGGGGGGLTLPFTASTSAPNGNAFQITNSGATGTAISGNGQYWGGLFQGQDQVSGVGVAGTGGSQGVWGSGTNEGVYGESFTGFGVHGFYGFGTFIPNGTKSGVYGHTTSNNAASAGMRGEATIGFGVQGTSSTGTGVQGQSSQGFGVYGTTTGSTKAGVFGQTSVANTSGVLGRVEANSGDASAVFGYASSGGVGLLGISEGNDGVQARSNAAGHSGIWGYSTNAAGYGGAFSNSGGGVALLVSGLAQISTLQITGADLAESFPDGGERLEPGTVLEIVGDDQGSLRESRSAYDLRVAGVVSGANGLPAGVVLEGHEFSAAGKVQVAMSGRVWVQCDATHGPIHVGDLLTTSDEPGRAMKATDTARSTGAILGKAMTNLEAGHGQVLVLVSLQ